MICWDKRFLDLAATVAGWSKDPSTRVGCVLVDDRRRVLGLGYNGFPRAVADLPQRLGDREQKLARTVHAELNAVLNASGDLRGSTAYVTMPPCSHCAAVLIQVGVTRVVARSPVAETAKRWDFSWRIAESMFDEAGVTLEV